MKTPITNLHVFLRMMKTNYDAFITILVNIIRGNHVRVGVARWFCCLLHPAWVDPVTGPRPGCLYADARLRWGAVRVPTLNGANTLSISRNQSGWSPRISRLRIGSLVFLTTHDKGNSDSSHGIGEQSFRIQPIFWESGEKWFSFKIRIWIQTLPLNWPYSSFCKRIRSRS